MIDEVVSFPAAARRIFCNRTLNLRAIAAVGCDMDYTLIHYRAERWEARAYEYVRAMLLERGFPVADLKFTPELVTLGLIIDVELGNLVKANRFGHVRRACHGTRMLSHQEQLDIYSQAPVELHESRWQFMNTLFSLSEACIFIQLVELLDAGQLPGILGYADLYREVKACLDAAHLEGKLKEEIQRDPEKFVAIDEELPQALLDLKGAGKRLLLITNSEWGYTETMMSYAFDRFLPGSMGWRDLFEIVIVQAGKPTFFSARSPSYRLVDHERGLFVPQVGNLEPGNTYAGGHARLVEASLGLSSDQILYVGDHIFADVHVSKDLLRWRTALVLRELEAEIAEIERFEPDQLKLDALMAKKELLEHSFSQLRLELQRLAQVEANPQVTRASELKKRLQAIRAELLTLDEAIAPLAQAASSLLNARWGLLLRSGNDKSHLARQIERYADVYMSRVSNLLAYTPFAYLRAHRGNLPHDLGIPGI